MNTGKKWAFSFKIDSHCDGYWFLVTLMEKTTTPINYMVYTHEEKDDKEYYRGFFTTNEDTKKKYLKKIINRADIFIRPFRGSLDEFKQKIAHIYQNELKWDFRKGSGYIDVFGIEPEKLDEGKHPGQKMEDYVVIDHGQQEAIDHEQQERNRDYITSQN